MNFSYWEHKTWLSNIDFAIIGSGIVGLSCALALRERFPKSKIVVFEKGILPSGASTKNAGFACFGSVSEILDDLNTHSEEEVISLVRTRLEGLTTLRDLLGDKAIDFRQFGGYELFASNDVDLFEECLSKMDFVNSLLNGVISSKKAIFLAKNDPFSFKNVQKQVIFNEFEGQLDTGKMMKAFLQKCAKKDIILINSVEINSFSEQNGRISAIFNNSKEVLTRKLFIANNGFAKQFMDLDVQAARAQVLITKPISKLKIKGTFHLDKGYYYFRNVDNRILLGGGRNLDFKGEETTEFGLTDLIQNKLETLLRTTILPNTPFEIDTRWSGIMGVGAQKKPIIRELIPNVYCGVRLGGMGVAIGSSVGKQLAEMA